VPTALITGITGQDGSYLAEFLLARGYRVIGLVRPESEHPLDRLAVIRERVTLVEASLLDQKQLQSIVEKHAPSEIYNLAARASSSQLFSEPLLTCEFNGLAVARQLELVRLIDPKIRFCQASSSEMFGNAVESPQSEETPFQPRNPYGIAKLFAHGMVGSYRETHGIFACSSILFNHESPRRGKEFVTRKISMAVARIAQGQASSLELGNLDATRDWGYAADYVRAMWQMLQSSSPGDYVLATGISHSVREFCDIAFRHVGLDYRNYVIQSPGVHRAGEVAPLVGNSAKARDKLEWAPSVSFEDLVRMMVDADIRALKENGRPLK
jgi:GDPmannose 4,6-dehydratase